jgi:hypothetical protein
MRKNERSRMVMEALYRPLSLSQAPVLFTDRRSAEIIKYATNVQGTDDDPIRAPFSRQRSLSSMKSQTSASEQAPIFSKLRADSASTVELAPNSSTLGPGTGVLFPQRHLGPDQNR